MKSINVLLIDDDEDDRDVFTSAISLVSSKLNCTAINDATSALYKMEQNIINPDVIFLDLNMPKMDGKEFFMLMRAQQRFRDIPVVLFSTSNYLECVKSDELCTTPFIAKPEDFTGLINILRNYFEPHMLSASA